MSKDETCDWTIQDFSAKYDSIKIMTEFNYVRRNPEDAIVKFFYGPTGQEPISELSGVEDHDDGTADCSGKPRSWATDLPIPTGYNVLIQLVKDDVVKSDARAVVG